MHVLVADGELVEIAGGLVDRPTQQVFLPGEHVLQVTEGAGAVWQVELPARGVRDVTRVPEPVAALDQLCEAVRLAQRPVFVEPGHMADLPEHGIDDVQTRPHQFRP